MADCDPVEDVIEDVVVNPDRGLVVEFLRLAAPAALVSFAAAGVLRKTRAGGN